MTEVAVTLGRNFHDYAEHDPCDGCSAPCCRLVINTQTEPVTFTCLDRFRYLVGHRGAELLVDAEGAWHLSTRNPCDLLDGNRCSVHGTPRQPKICVDYDARGCWYKRNFHDEPGAVDVVRLDLEGFERVLHEVRFDDEGVIVAMPSYDELRRLASPPVPPPPA